MHLTAHMHRCIAFALKLVVYVLVPQSCALRAHLMPVLAMLLAVCMTDHLLCVWSPHVALAEHSCDCCVVTLNRIFTFGILATELGIDGIVICGDVGLNMSCCMMFRIESSHAKGLTPFQDVRLGPLVGKGSFGKVYRGIWDNVIVAIKVSLLQVGMTNMLLPLRLVDKLPSRCLQKACCEGVTLPVSCFTFLSACQAITCMC